MSASCCCSASRLIANLRAQARRPQEPRSGRSASLGFLTGLYNWVFYADLIQRAGFLTTPDLVVGTVLIVLVFEAARRLMGLPLTIICGAFLAYCFLGQYLPPPLIHRGYDFAQIVDYFAFGTEGIYGTPVYVSAAYIFIFVVFAAFLERAGMIALFNDVALGLVGRWRGGPAQVCVLSSALDGHDLRLGRRQRRGERPVHHPADEALRLQAGLRRRRRGDVVDGRPDHAAGHGRGRLHHGRDAEHPLRRGGQGGDHPGDPLLRRLLLAGPSRGRQGRSCTAWPRRSCPIPGMR